MLDSGPSPPIIPTVFTLYRKMLRKPKRVRFPVSVLKRERRRAAKFGCHRILSFAIVEKDRPDHNQADRPNPGECTYASPRKADFEPPRPPGNRRQNRERKVAQLSEEFFLHVLHRMRVGH